MSSRVEETLRMPFIDQYDIHKNHKLLTLSSLFLYASALANVCMKGRSRGLSSDSKFLRIGGVRHRA